jgi:hypothetical protein
MDGAGEQRMLMLGIREQGRNKTNRPDKSRKGRLNVANKSGDLDCYVAHFDQPERVGPEAVHPIWEALSTAMKGMLPSAFSTLERELRAARVHDRCYSSTALRLTSTDLIVNNVGVSSHYESPAHYDANDIGWTVGHQPWTLTLVFECSSSAPLLQPPLLSKDQHSSPSEDSRRGQVLHTCVVELECEWL